MQTWRPAFLALVRTFEVSIPPRPSRECSPMSGRPDPAEVWDAPDEYDCYLLNEDGVEGPLTPAQIGGRFLDVFLDDPLWHAAALRHAPEVEES